MPNFFDKYPYTDFHELNLDWIIKTVKETVAEWAVTLTEWHNTQEEWQQLYDYVHDYFDNLDVQQEINNKLDEMVADGTLATLAQPFIDAKVADLLPAEVAGQIGGVVAAQIGPTVASQINAAVASQIGPVVAPAAADWLADNITNPSNPPLDISLTVGSSAADSAAAGDRIRADERAVIDAGVYGVFEGDPMMYYLRDDGTLNSYSQLGYVTDFIPCKEGQKFNYHGLYGFNAAAACFYMNGTFVSAVTRASFSTIDSVITIPSGVNQVRFGSTNTVVLKVTMIGNVFDHDFNSASSHSLFDIINTGEYKNIPLSGVYLNIDGTYSADANPAYITNPIPVQEGDQFYYKGLYGSNAAAACFYKDNEFVSSISKAAFAVEEITITVPSGVDTMLIGSYNVNFTAYPLGDQMIKNKIIGTSPLDGKKWIAFGDSFTSGDFTGYVDGDGNTGTASDAYDPAAGMYKTWAWHIMKRHNMKLTNLAQGGAKSTYLTDSYLYTTVPADTDFVTIMLGLNDSVFDGDINSMDPTTFYGAWNVTYNWLRTNRPACRIGMIINSAWLTISARNRLLSIAERNGVAVLDMYNDPKVPGLMGTPDGTRLAKANMNASVSVVLTNQNVLDPVNNWHPNLSCYAQMSDSIAEFMKML